MWARMQERERLNKMMVREILLVGVLVFVMATFTASAHETGASDEDDHPLATTDAYERIESYGFPQGILPHTITGYTLEPSGRFTLYLEGECKVLIQHKYPLEYHKVITGLLSYGELQDLKGIRVKAFYVWWSITAISRNSDDSLSFAIGILSAKFPLESFDDPPICERKLSSSSSSFWEHDDDDGEEVQGSRLRSHGMELNQELLSLEKKMMMLHHHQGFLQ